MERATDKDRSYFERISRANRELEDGIVPESLAKMFDRLEASRGRGVRQDGPGPSDDEGDLEAHLRFLEMARRVRGRAAERA